MRHPRSAVLVLLVALAMTLVPAEAVNAGAKCPAAGLTAAESVNFICCAKIVRPRVGGPVNTDCCGTSSFDVTKVKCCDGNLQPLAVGGLADTGCCAKTSFDTKQRICCDNTNLWPLVPNRPQDTRCCKKQVFDVTASTCCNEAIVPLPKPIPAGGLMCCDRLLYVATEKVCCHGLLCPKPAGIADPDLACCTPKGGVSVVYDSKKFRCCPPKGVKVVREKGKKKPQLDCLEDAAGNTIFGQGSAPDGKPLPK